MTRLVLLALLALAGCVRTVELTPPPDAGVDAPLIDADVDGSTIDAATTDAP